MVSKEITPDRAVSDLFNYLMYGWLFSPPLSSPSVVSSESSSMLVIVLICVLILCVDLVVGVGILLLTMLPLSQMSLLYPLIDLIYKTKVYIGWYLVFMILWAQI
jgi:hypothetical protein